MKPATKATRFAANHASGSGPGAMVADLTMNKEIAKLYKTARATISCAKFKAGDYVAVRYFATDENGKHWFECANEKFPNPLPPLWHKSAFYPENHLEAFCL